MAVGKILVVDDNARTIISVESYLVKAGYQVFDCSSGAEALRFLDENSVDLILLDINMPGLTGYETCSRIRNKFPIDDLPIIFFTGREDAESIISGFKSGASDFVSKTFLPEILLARVSVHIRMSQTLRKIREISLTDDLTQVYNRRHAIYTLHEWFARSKRYGTAFSLIYFDLNAFKEINDNYGHQAGDLLLCSVTGAIKKILRASDMLFRMGGDEFMVLCPDTGKDGAKKCVDHMKKALQDVAIAGRSPTFAYGIVHSMDDYNEMDNMLSSADNAMYACKMKMKDKGTSKNSFL
ncbi:MAG: diguanylate cyclase [Fibrobacteraceae bacterium]|nr:diguanylate cyclase [Fibrobacteraceae bacterium]